MNRGDLMARGVECSLYDNELYLKHDLVPMRIYPVGLAYFRFYYITTFKAFCICCAPLFPTISSPAHNPESRIASPQHQVVTFTMSFSSLAGESMFSNGDTDSGYSSASEMEGDAAFVSFSKKHLQFLNRQLAKMEAPGE